MKINMVLEPNYSETELIKNRFGYEEKKFLGFTPKVEVSIVLNGSESRWLISQRGDTVQECIDKIKELVQKKIQEEQKYQWENKSEFDFEIEKDE